MSSENLPPYPFHARFQNFSRVLATSPFFTQEKSLRIYRGVYLKIEDSCGLEPHMRRLAPSACLLLSYVCPQCSYHLSSLASFFFLWNLLGVLPCRRLWHFTHRLIRLSSSNPSSGCSFSSTIWCTSSALLIFLSSPCRMRPAATASSNLFLQSWHS